MTTTDYNDSKWHGWNGGTIPVHPKTNGEFMFADGEILANKPAGDWCWSDNELPIVAFRVTKECKEPQEYWLCYVHTWDTPHVHTYAPKDDGYYIKVTHVREVT